MSPSPYLPDDVAEADPDDSWAEEDRRDADRRPGDFAAWIDDTYCYDPERRVDLDDEERDR